MLQTDLFYFLIIYSFVYFSAFKAQKRTTQNIKPLYFVIVTTKRINWYYFLRFSFLSIPSFNKRETTTINDKYKMNNRGKGKFFDLKLTPLSFVFASLIMFEFLTVLSRIRSSPRWLILWKGGVIEYFRYSALSFSLQTNKAKEKVD